MANEKEYTIVANITGVENDGTIHLTGVGKYAYATDKTKWLILEGSSADTSRFLDEKTEFVVGAQDEIHKIVLATAMINKKALRLTIETSTQNTYSIISIENP